MSRKNRTKHPLYEYDKQLASAFKDDCEDFLKEFEKLESFNFPDFAMLWQQKNFTLVFADHRYALLLKDFCENCFYIIKKFIIFARNLYTQIGAFYLLYGLYYKQPLRQWIKIRLTLEEYQEISNLIDLMKSRQQLDAVYIFSKMKVEQAFLYVALRKPLGPEDRFVKNCEVYVDDTFDSYKRESALVKFKEFSSNHLIKRMEKLNNDYQKQLEEYSEIYPSLSTFTSTIIHDLKAAFSEINGNINEVNHKKSENSIASKRNSVKNKALTNKNAIYRGCKKVKSAVDKDFNLNIK